MRISISNITSKINGEFVDLCKKYYEQIPLKQIFKICHKYGYTPIDEEGSPWQGFLLGKDGRASIDLKETKKTLNIQWHRMESGRYEVNCYIN